MDSVSFMRLTIRWRRMHRVDTAKQVPPRAVCLPQTLPKQVLHFQSLGGSITKGPEAICVNIAWGGYPGWTHWVLIIRILIADAWLRSLRHSAR